MKKVRFAAVAGVATFALAAPAVAQTPPLDVQVTASAKALTKVKSTAKKGEPIKAGTGFTANAEAKQTVSEMRFYLPKTGKLSGNGFPKCTVATITSQGPAACPKKSQVGAGTASAVLGGPNPSPLRFQTRLFNGGGNKVALFVAGVGTDVGTPIEGVIKKSGLAPYGQVLTVPIPTSLQSPVPGLYSYITGVDTTISGTITKKGKKIGYAQQYGCPKDKKHHFGVQLVTVPNDANSSGSTTQVFEKTVACKP